jgi:hypothetical protein
MEGQEMALFTCRHCGASSEAMWIGRHFCSPTCEEAFTSQVLDAVRQAAKTASTEHCFQAASEAFAEVVTSAITEDVLERAFLVSNEVDDRHRARALLVSNQVDNRHRERMPARAAGRR